MVSLQKCAEGRRDRSEVELAGGQSASPGQALNIDVVARRDAGIDRRSESRGERDVVAVGVLDVHFVADQLRGADLLAVVRREHRANVRVRRAAGVAEAEAEAAAHGTHGLAVELFGDGQVFDHQRVHGKSPGSEGQSLAVGFEHLVCSSVTNAWAVPVLFVRPNKAGEALIVKGFASRRGGQTSGWRLTSNGKLMGRTQQRAGFCWMPQDTGGRRRQRGNPGLRKHGSGTSIEAAHVTGYDRFSIGPTGPGRMRSGPTAAGALRTYG